jgi:hypothetical protein
MGKYFRPGGFLIVMVKMYPQSRGKILYIGQKIPTIGDPIERSAGAAFAELCQAKAFNRLSLYQGSSMEFL